MTDFVMPPSQMLNATPAPKRILPVPITSPSTPTAKLTKKKQPVTLHTLTTTGTWQPIGTIWQNNSCAYDTVITILFNIW
jgi:hypothetical protein